MLMEGFRENVLDKMFSIKVNYFVRAHILGVVSFQDRWYALFTTEVHVGSKETIGAFIQLVDVNTSSSSAIEDATFLRACTN